MSSVKKIIIREYNRIDQELSLKLKYVNTSLNRLKDKIVQMQNELKRDFIFHIENLIIWAFIIIVILSLIFNSLNFFSFNVSTTNVINILGTLIQSLTGIFAIVFSISLVMIERYSEEQSKLIIYLYFSNLYFIVPFIFNFISILLNLYFYFNESAHHLIGFGFILSFAAIFSLIPFFYYTIKFLMVENVIAILLRKIKIKTKLLSTDYTEEPLYRRHLQPIEEIIIRKITLRHYSSAKYLIDNVNSKTSESLIIVKEIFSSSTSDQHHIQSVRFMSLPFNKLFSSIASYATKFDAFEITKYIIEIIIGLIEDFDDKRFLPSFNIYDKSVNEMYNQAREIFSSKEYEITLTRLGVLLSDVEVKFSEYLV